MSRELTNDTDHEERLNEVLLAYVEDLEAGREPDLQRLLLDHPDLREDLEIFISSRDEINRLAAPLRSVTGPFATHETGLHQTQSEGQSNESPPDIGQLGDFRILREIGRGGMGVVYEAQQISLRRRVALKVLPFAAAIDQRQLQRFKNEALAAAHLQHSNIVPVHAVGCERGVHYYAMQFIEGQSLSELIADLRRLDSDTANPVSRSSQTQVDTSGSVTAVSVTRTRISGGRGHFDWVARLGRQAAMALEHAHQTGVVHRDIKPSNLLLDPHGQLWITDFGLAQVGGDANLTATGELLGTLRYSSPEQAMARRGIVDHRSDIYSLGATLYELLTLRPVFEGRDRGELLRQIADEDPPLPRSLDSTIPEDLETILLKALRKEPAERYATADDMANDLQRFLDNRPILARRPTVVEHLRKWIRRHPSMIVTGVVTLLLLSIGSIMSAALIKLEQGRTKIAQQAAETALDRERLRAEEAESQYRLARRSVDELIQVSEEELAHRQGMEGLRKRLLTSALAYYQEFSKQHHEDARTQAELADTTRRVEGILADLAVLRSSGQMYLLAQADVLDDLHLSGDQPAKLKDLVARIGKQWRGSFYEFRNLPSVERGRRTLERARKNEADLNAVLTPAQQLRLRQIALQVEGPGAFRNHEVVTALQLTLSQREQIRRIEEEAFMERSRTPKPSNGAEAQPADPDHKVIPVNEKILILLSDKQRQQWKEMTGDAFKGNIPQFTPFNRSSPPKRQ